MDRMVLKKAFQIFVCLLCWLTMSIVFPFLAKRWGITRQRWLRILLTLVSPAALLTYLFIIFLADSGDYSVDPEKTEFRKRNEIVALTGFTDLPGFTFVSATSNDWTRVTRARYAYEDWGTLSDSAGGFLQNIYGDFWDTVEPADTSLLGKRCPRYSHGWFSGVVDKPSDTLPDDTHVSITFGREGFEVVYHPNDSFFFEGWMSPEDLKRKTGADFPAFEAFDYELRYDESAFLAIRFLEDPDDRFYSQFKSSLSWEESAGDYTFKMQIGKYSDWLYRISVDKNSPTATLCYYKKR